MNSNNKILKEKVKNNNKNTKKIKKSKGKREHIKTSSNEISECEQKIKIILLI